jgi:flagellar biosynthesis/type III secretory pathway protein FliH
MERLGADDARITDWAARVLDPVVERATEPEPDPRLLLEQQRQQLLEAAREEGLRAGLLDAEDTVNTRIKSAEQRVTESHAVESARLQRANADMAALLAALPAAIADVESRIETAAAEIAFAAVTRVLGERNADRSLLAQVCAQAIAEYRLRPVTLRLAADDIDCVQPLLDGEDITLVVDNRLQRGQCQLDGHKGLFDTGIEVRLEALKQALLRGLQDSESPR